jgi:hypothetical protein
VFYQVLEWSLKELKKNFFSSRFCIVLFGLPGSESDECKTFPLMAFPLFTDDDSLLLVDENDIRELSSPRDQ